MWEESWSQGRTVEPVKAKVRAMSALHMHSPIHTLTSPQYISATDFHCKWLFSECFRAKHIPHRKMGLHHVFYRFIKSNEICDLHAHHPLPIFLPEKQVLPHKFKSIYSSLCLWCMKRRVYSYRDRPLAGPLMGYGPQLHLFHWIFLHGSAWQRHVRGCTGEGNGEVVVWETAAIIPDFMDIIPVAI